jgi:hypothetical protein
MKVSVPCCVVGLTSSAPESGAVPPSMLYVESPAKHAAPCDHTWFPLPPPPRAVVWSVQLLAAQLGVGTEPWEARVSRVGWSHTALLPCTLKSALLHQTVTVS